MSSRFPKVVLIGVDGASLDFIKKNIKRLPAFKTLIENGASGNLLSNPPFVSPALWVEIATGKKRDKTNIRGFFSKKTDRKEPFIWEILSLTSLKSGLIEYLMADDRDRNIQFFIPSWMESNIYAKPDFLIPYKQWTETHLVRRNLFKLMNFYSFIKKIKMKFQKNKDIWQVLYYQLREELKTNAFIKAIKKIPVDFAAVSFYAADAIQHSHLKYTDPEYFGIRPEPKLKESIFDIYRAIDRQIRKIMNIIPKNTYIIIVSDHGQEKTSLDIFQRNMIKPANFLKNIEYSGEGNTYALGNTIHIQTIPENRKDLESILRDAVIKDSDINIFNVFSSENELSFSLKNECERKIPDLINKQAVIGGKVINLKKLIKQVELSGIHSKEGTFIATGPGIKYDFNINEISILDIAPLMLYMYSMPLDKTFDGKLRTEIFTQEFLDKNPVSYVDRYDFDLTGSESGEDKHLEEKLKNLGYL
ncbi:MAG: alkaline phosphatase family protein [bacterium]|nr:alkaline phosphatase family protein [bacterium]